MAWRCGDTIEMPGEVDQPATVICDGVKLFRGRVGRRNNNLAVRIEEDLAEGEERMDDVEDRKSTRLTPVTNAHLVCRLLLEKKKKKEQKPLTKHNEPHQHKRVRKYIDNICDMK